MVTCTKSFLTFKIVALRIGSQIVIHFHIMYVLAKSCGATPSLCLRANDVRLSQERKFPWTLHSHEMLPLRNFEVYSFPLPSSFQLNASLENNFKV